MNNELKHNGAGFSAPQALTKSFCGGPGGSFFKKRPLAAGGIFFYVIFFSFMFLTAQAETVDKRLGRQVYIEAGTYWVGDDEAEDNRPYRRVSVEGFYIDIHPVTNGQYLQFLSGSGYKPKGTFDAAKAETSPLLPAGGLVYEDAEAYAKSYKKRLPTEWEWEIAARSLKKENVHVNPDVPHHKSGHFLFNKRYYKLPVFSYPPNELGIYGMVGNVLEWTSGEYEERYLHGKYFKGHPLKVLRGGSWTNKAFDIRATTRTPFSADRCLEWLGFRCVAELPPAARGAFL
jgi:formylglycine-generating enzyme required for sulfatase activity